MDLSGEPTPVALARFVASGRPERRRYMSKSQRACDLCRSRKSACRTDRLGFPCRLCDSQGQQCTFDSGPVRRCGRSSQWNENRQRPAVEAGSAMVAGGPANDIGLQPNPDEAEGMISLPLHDAPDFHPGFGTLDGWDSPTDQLFDNSLLFTQEILMPPGLERDLAELGGHEATTNASTDSTLDLNLQSISHSPYTAPSALPESLPLEFAIENTIMQVMGPTSDQDPHLMKYHRYGPNNVFTYNRISYRTVVDHESDVQFEYTRPELVSASIGESSKPATLSNDRKKLDNMISPEAGVRLIELFYKFVNNQFPILSPSEIPTPADCPTHLLAAIYLISEQFADFDDYLCIHIIYKSTPLKDLFDIAWTLICKSMDRPSISIIQAGLIILLRAPIDPLGLDQPFKWSLLGSLTNMAQTLGLHLDPGDWRIPPQEIQVRKRLSWLLYASDKWFAFSFGRPANLSRENWSITQIQPMSPAHSNTNCTDAYSALFSRLTNILDTVLKLLFSLAALEALRNDYTKTLNLARPLLSELSSWHDEVSSLIPRDYDARESSPFDNWASLELGYHSVQLLIFRAILRSFRSDLPVVGNREMPSWKESNSQSRVAAKNAVIAAHNFVSALSTRQFQPFWAPWSRTQFTMTCSVCIVLLVSSRSVAEVTEYKDILDKARRALRTQSRSFEMMRFALLKMDAIFWVGFDKVFRSDIEMGGCF